MISAIFGLGPKTWKKARQASPSITYSNPRPISLIFQDSNHVFYIYSHLRDKTHFSGSFSTQSYRSQPQKMSLHNHFVRDHCTNLGVGILSTIVLNSLVWVLSALVLNSRVGVLSTLVLNSRVGVLSTLVLNSRVWVFGTLVLNLWVWV